MKRAQAKAKSTHVSFIVQPNGDVWVTATGQNGSLQLELSGGKEPTMAIVDRDRPGKYKGAWGLLANGRLKGWLVDQDDRIQWFPKRAKPQQKQTKKAPSVKGKAQRHTK